MLKIMSTYDHHSVYTLKLKMPLSLFLPIPVSLLLLKGNHCP